MSANDGKEEHPERASGSVVSDDEMLDLQREVANRIVQKVNAARRESKVIEAIELLMTRMVHAGDSLAVLRKHSPHDFRFDGAMILRGIYDAMLQALYILEAPSKSEERAELYLDYYWIE